MVTTRLEWAAGAYSSINKAARAQVALVNISVFFGVGAAAADLLDRLMMPARWCLKVVDCQNAS